MTTLTALQILQQFDLVDFGNFSGSSDVEGRAAIGGNLVSGGTFYTNPNGVAGTSSSSSFQALTVYGSVDSQINLNNSGDAYVAGSGGASNQKGGEISYNGGSQVTTSPPETMAQLKSTLTALNTSLTSLSGAGAGTVNTSNPNDVTFTYTGTNKTALFNITASEVSSWSSVSFNVASTVTSIIVNVSGSGAFTGDFNFIGTNEATKTIWNFASTITSVSVQSWNGTILAPGATVNNSSAIDGTVVANSYTGSGEIHEYAYTGAVCFMAGTLVATPEGPRPIESLSSGDCVLTHHGEIQEILWVGRQTVSTRFADPLRVLPIRIRAGALGPDLPARDLRVSPCHALLIEGVLVQAGALVNGVTITRETDVAEVFTYFHVELADHALILAEGVAAETFIDNVQRLAFDNWAEHEAAIAGRPAMRELPMPRAQSARQLPPRVRAHLAARLNDLVEPLALAS